MKKAIFTVLLSIFAINLSWSQTATGNSDATKKGNKVFLQYTDVASREIEPYLIDALKQWGYWNIVTVKTDAQFVIEYTAVPFSGGFSVSNEFITRYGYIALKSIDDKELQRSKKMKGSPTAFNGYKAIKDLANKLVKKYLMVTFK